MALSHLVIALYTAHVIFIRDNSLFSFSNSSGKMKAHCKYCSEFLSPILLILFFLFFFFLSFFFKNSSEFMHWYIYGNATVIRNTRLPLLNVDWEGGGDLFSHSKSTNMKHWINNKVISDMQAAGDGLCSRITISKNAYRYKEKKLLCSLFYFSLVWTIVSPSKLVYSTYCRYCIL